MKSLLETVIADYEMHNSIKLRDWPITGESYGIPLEQELGC